MACSLLGLARSDLGGVALLGLSTLFRSSSGVFMGTGLPLRVRLLLRGGVWGAVSFTTSAAGRCRSFLS